MNEAAHLSLALTLEQKTQEYWALSRVYEGRSKKRISTERAISTTNNLLATLNPARPLFNSVARFQDTIISGSQQKLSQTGI